MFTNPELERMLREPYLDPDKLMTLIRRYRRAKEPELKHRLREEIFNNNVRFIRKVVMRKVKAADAVEDVFNAAVVAFFEGLEKFKPSKGYRFQTYIGFWIEKAIYEAYVGSNIVYVSRGDFFKKDVPRIFLAKNVALNYLDKPTVFSDGSEVSQWDLLEKQLMFKPDQSRLDHVAEKIGAVNKAMREALENAEFSILFWRYLCEPALTLDEIAPLLGVTRERVRQISVRAEWKIRKYISTNGRYEFNFRRAYRQMMEYTDEQRRQIHEQVVANRPPRKELVRAAKIKPKKNVKKA